MRNFVVFLAVTTSACLGHSESLIVLYGNTRTLSVPCEVLISDSATRPSNCDDAIAYVSVGEISAGDPRLSRIRSTGLLLGPSRQWHNALEVKADESQWWVEVAHQVEQRVAAGYDGVFFDTVDALCGKSSAVEKFEATLKRLDQEHRSVRWFINGGTCLSTTAWDRVDAVISESLFGGFDWKSNEFVIVHNEVNRSAEIRRLQRLRAQRPNLRVYVVDYVPASPRALRQSACERSAEAGFEIYFGPISLSRIDPLQCRLLGRLAKE
ncbi:MAG: endo alpha-1,4 polygalactosaminidase [Myxococcota bacterium]